MPQTVGTLKRNGKAAEASATLKCLGDPCGLERACWSPHPKEELTVAGDGTGPLQITKEHTGGAMGQGQGQSG